MVIDRTATLQQQILNLVTDNSVSITELNTDYHTGPNNDYVYDWFALTYAKMDKINKKAKIKVFHIDCDTAVTTEKHMEYMTSVIGVKEEYDDILVLFNVNYQEEGRTLNEACQKFGELGFVSEDNLNKGVTKIHNNMYTDRHTLNRSIGIYSKDNIKVLAYMDSEADSFNPAFVRLYSLILPRLIPSAFTDAEAVNEYKEKLLLPLTQADFGTKYIQTETYKVMQPYKKETIKMATHDLFDYTVEREMEKLHIRCCELKNKYSRAMADIKQILSDIQKAEYDIALRKSGGSRKDEKLDELVTFLGTNRNIDILGANLHENIFIVKGPLVYFEDRENIFKATINKEDSYLYTSVAETINKEFLKDLYTKLFLSREYVVNFYSVCGLYCSLDTPRLEFRYRANVDYQTNHQFAVNAIPNPHIMGYNCPGGHYTQIVHMLERNNIPGALAQYMSANSNLNLFDSTVVMSFIHGITDDREYKKCKCIQKKGDDKYYSVEDLENEFNKEKKNEL